MNLLNFAMTKNIPASAFFLLLQWFQILLRSGTSDVVHFMNKVEGCGEIIHADARKEFFSILRAVVTMLKVLDDVKQINFALDTFYWSYRTVDLVELANTGIFKVLQDGNGSRLSPIRMAWGRILHQKKDQKDDSLTRRVIKVFNFLYKIVLRSIVSEDTSFNVENDPRMSSINMK